MKKNYLTILTLITILLAACGTAEPALSSEDIANTAVADAWIAITQTQAALPTFTLAPPTATPGPTLVPLQTLPPLPTFPPATVSTGPTIDPCNQVPPIKPLGALVKVKLVNKSEGFVNLSLGMSYPNDKGECVTYSYTLAVFDEPVVTVLAGCYWGWAWITGKEPSVAKTGGTILCVSDPNKIPPIWITKETIYLH